MLINVNQTACQPLVDTETFAPISLNLSSPLSLTSDLACSQRTMFEPFAKGTEEDHWKKSASYTAVAATNNTGFAVPGSSARSEPLL